MRFPSLFWTLCLLLAACGDTPAEVAEAPVQEAPEPLAIPSPVALNAEVQRMIGPWSEFRDWSERMDVLLVTEGEEDILLLTEEILELVKVLEESTFPDMADRPSVRSRIKVVRTFLIQLEADFHYRQDHRFTVKRLAEAYNALRGQLNRLPTMTLDPIIFER